jgi:predicted aspartyl protease
MIPLRRSPGERLLRRNELDEAETVLAEEAGHTRRARPLVLVGHLALMRNDLTAAHDALTRAVARNSRLRQAHELLAEVAYRRDDYGTAAGHQEAAGHPAVAAKLRSFDGRPPYTVDMTSTVRVPFLRKEPLPVVAAEVDGVPVRLLIDTGGAELILDAAFAATHDVSTFGGEKGYFGGGRTATVQQASARTLRLGDLTLGDLPAQVMDLAGIGPMLGEPELAGILGTCVLARFQATLDYPGAALVLAPRGAPLRPGPDAVEVPVRMADDHYLLAVGHLDDGPPLTLFVDSGLAGGAFAAPASTLSAAGVRRSGPSVEGQGAGGAMAAWPFDVASLSLGAARREGLVGIGGAFPPQLEWALGFRIGGLVSHGFLDAYAVTIDLDRMVLVLDPGEGRTAPR